MNRVFEFDLYKTPETRRNEKFQQEISPASPKKFLNLRDIRELIKMKRTKTLENLRSGVCKYHNKNFEVICMKEKIRICTDCAIFGKHKNHNFISFHEAVMKEERSLNYIMASALDLRSECCDLLDKGNGTTQKNFENKMEEYMVEKKEEVFTEMKIKFTVSCPLLTLIRRSGLRSTSLSRKLVIR